MAETLIIRNALIVNEDHSFYGDLLVRDERIHKIDKHIDANADIEIEGKGLILMPGIIDDQVHFREPGLSHKATVFTESRAAAAGGVTSFMDMPNTNPATLTQDLLQGRYEHAAKQSVVNYSFYMGASNDNLEQVLQTDPSNVCGIKIFMGSSTGNMLVDEMAVLESIFSRSPMLIATHCEDETTIRENTELFTKKYGDRLDASYHPKIRTDEACYLSSSKAVDLAKKYSTRLHVLHLTTAKEMALFNNDLPLAEKKITAEVCVHHLFFNQGSYDKLGNRLKCNPAVKTKNDQDALWTALLNDQLDVIATDHAPHTKDEKARPFLKAPSGLPLVQHSLLAMYDMHLENKISLAKMVAKMAHAPAVAYKIRERGFLREGYFADLVLLDPKRDTNVQTSNILYKCGWSPFEGHIFRSSVDTTIVNGGIVYQRGRFINENKAKRLKFYAS
jgi:dihydroorotase